MCILGANFQGAWFRCDCGTEVMVEHGCMAMDTETRPAELGWAYDHFAYPPRNYDGGFRDSPFTFYCCSVECLKKRNPKSASWLTYMREHGDAIGWVWEG